MRGFGSFMAGFFAIGLLWGGYALYLDIQTGSIMSMRMAEVFPMDLDPTLLALITAGIGAIVGGFATLTGSLGRSMFRK